MSFLIFVQKASMPVNHALCSLDDAAWPYLIKFVYQMATLSALDLTRFAIQAMGPDGKWTRQLLAYRESKYVHLRVIRPPEVCVNLVFKHIHATSRYTIRRQFVPFIYCSL